MLHTKVVEKIKTRDLRSSEILVAYVGTLFLTFRDNLSPIFKGEARADRLSRNYYNLSQQMHRIVSQLQSHYKSH
jgi:hypothetical protein